MTAFYTVSGTHRENINVKDDEVECERKSHGTDEPHVGPWGHRDQRLVLRQRVHGVQHLDGDEHRQSHRHRMGVREDLAVDALDNTSNNVNKNLRLQ